MWAGIAVRDCCCADTCGQESLSEIVVVPTHVGRNRCQRLLLCRPMWAGFAVRDCCCADIWGPKSLSETAVVPTHGAGILRRIHGLRNFCCADIDAEFATRDGLKMHLSQSHASVKLCRQQRIFNYCDFAGKGSMTQSFSRQMKLVSEEKVFRSASYCWIFHHVSICSSLMNPSSKRLFPLPLTPVMAYTPNEVNFISNSCRWRRVEVHCAIKNLVTPPFLSYLKSDLYLSFRLQSFTDWQRSDKSIFNLSDFM